MVYKKDPLSVEHSKRHGKAVKLGLKRATKLKRQVKRASLMLRNNTKEQLCKSLRFLDDGYRYTRGMVLYLDSYIVSKMGGMTNVPFPNALALLKEWEERYE